jgi:polysaccharide deacetylase family protein (PEP-CTERM system associated)
VSIAPTQHEQPPALSAAESSLPVILSFDVEEHDRIEAASGLTLADSTRAEYRRRLRHSTTWILELLGQSNIRATFFVVGQIAEHDPKLVREIGDAGHEVASHGWDHQRVHNFSRQTFCDDVRRSCTALEDVTGQAVVGYRAPTFSIVRETAWALDVLAELGLEYDSSIYPVRHDRYGVPAAPRTPFLACGEHRSILELPPATLRLGGINWPMGGGGYFRLFPTFMTHVAVRQMRGRGRTAVANLYFHPWEFDRDQPRLPLCRLSRFRTYVGIGRNQKRLAAFLKRHRFGCAMDVARELRHCQSELETFRLSDS